MFKHVLVTFAVLAVLSPGIIHSAPDNSAAVRPDFKLNLMVRTRLNPRGFSFRPALAYRIPLTGSQHLLLRGTYVDLGVTTPVSPASFHPGAFVEAVPITPLVLRLSAQHLRYFGLFGNLVSYPGLDAEWHPDTREGTVTDGRHETGYRLRAEATLRLAFGPVIALGK